jgi:uncharacterized membrane protein YcaP (DUF421 family)
MVRMIGDQIVTCQARLRQTRGDYSLTGAFDEVQWAVLETSGAISFVGKPDA